MNYARKYANVRGYRHKVKLADGREFSTICDACRTLGMNINTGYYRWVQKKYPFSNTPLDYGHVPVRLADGREYPSITACAKSLGIALSTLYRRLNRGQIPFTDIRPVRTGRPKEKWNEK